MKCEKKKQIKILIFAILFLLLCVTWILFPRSLQNEISEADIIVISTSISQINADGKARTENQSYTLQPGSSKYQKITNLLNSYTFHNNLKSFFAVNNFTMNRQTTTILISSEDCCITLTDGGDLAIERSADTGTRLYSIGYFGNRKAEELCEEIQGILECSTTAN